MLEPYHRFFGTAFFVVALFAPARLLGQGAPAGDPNLGEAAAKQDFGGDAYAAYAAGAFDQALQSFVDAQVEQPDNPEIMLNIGAAHMGMKNYEEAEKSFAAAAAAGDKTLGAQALYNLGVVAFAQGKLEDAVERFRAALELDPNDADAKYNLEFVRDEIRRRHEEAQKRQQQAGNQQDGDNQPQDSQQNDASATPQSGDEGAKATDSDQDGLSDATETDGKNPTDPKNADTDGDGIPDGQEDLNHNGQVDAAETDPTKQDSDGDGKTDGAKAQQGDNPAPQEAGDAGEPPPGAAREMTPQEAERYLQSLSDDRPKNRRPARSGPRRVEKDW